MSWKKSVQMPPSLAATCICPAADHCEYPITYSKGTNYQEVEITSLVQH